MVKKPLSQCPVCNGQLQIARLTCPACGISLEGDLPASRLSLLSADQQQFVETFLRAGGNIKEVERELGISYPTVRKKLDEVVQVLGYGSRSQIRRREEVLEAVDRGDIPPKEGIRLLRELRDHAYA
jgi:hypothetical protein